MADDIDHMASALRLAQRGLGQVWPNPAVGCVIVSNGRVVGRGWTQPGGRPHAETEALARAGDLARDATAYVTLEPCSHHGKTPPCADALVAAGIGRVVAATVDPDPRVSGRGLDRLRVAGVAITTGVMEREAQDLNAGFFSRIMRGRPLVTLKLATSLDGRIATRSGESRWITGEEARHRGHLLRAENDAIMVGSGTALADDPSLTCRLPGLEHRSPVRVVVDSRMRLPPTAALITTASLDLPTWIITTTNTPLQAAGISVIATSTNENGRVDLAEALQLLGSRGITRVLIEGGGELAASALRLGLVDRLVWFRAPIVLGGDGIPAVAALALDQLADCPLYRRLAAIEVGADVMEVFERR